MRTWSSAAFSSLVKWLKGRMAGHCLSPAAPRPRRSATDVKARAVEFAMLVDAQPR